MSPENNDEKSAAMNDRPTFGSLSSSPAFGFGQSGGQPFGSKGDLYHSLQLFYQAYITSIVILLGKPRLCIQQAQTFFLQEQTNICYSTRAVKGHKPSRVTGNETRCKQDQRTSFKISSIAG